VNELFGAYPLLKAMPLYKHLNPEIAKAINGTPARKQVKSSVDIVNWCKETAQKLDEDNCIITTFIIDQEETLWIADRHSEHIICADGQPVCSAGEMTFQLNGSLVSVTDVTNQSLGYCPPPETWFSVSNALNKARIPHPADFTCKMIFRQCTKCGSKNIVKDFWFVCDVCRNDLSKEWNFNNLLT
jgi:hypothetical protein